MHRAAQQGRAVFGRVAVDEQGDAAGFEVIAQQFGGQAARAPDDQAGVCQSRGQRQIKIGQNRRRKGPGHDPQRIRIARIQPCPQFYRHHIQPRPGQQPGERGDGEEMEVGDIIIHRQGQMAGTMRHFEKYRTTGL